MPKQHTFARYASGLRRVRLPAPPRCQAQDSGRGKHPEGGSPCLASWRAEFVEQEKRAKDYTQLTRRELQGFENMQGSWLCPWTFALCDSQISYPTDGSDRHFLLLAIAEEDYLDK